MQPISLRDVSVDYGGQVLAVDNASLEVAAGEFVALVGPSGCGKTTLLNLLTGLVPNERGVISIGGQPPRAGDPRVGYTLARDSLFPWRSALDNACYGMELRGVPRPEREARAREVLAQVGLKGFEAHHPKALSHGMRHRCALARTFCLDPQVLLMDEPFGALDAQTKIQLEDLLLQMWEKRRSTVVFVTHDLSEAVALADRVVVMSARPGRIVADMRIELPRPRQVRALQRDAAFLRLYGEVWEQLERGIQMSGRAQGEANGH